MQRIMMLFTQTMTPKRQNGNIWRRFGWCGAGRDAGAAGPCLPLWPTRMGPAYIMTRMAAALMLGLIMLAVPPSPASRAWASTSQRIVSDHYTGLAIDGFDPVAYFVARKPVRGLPEWELRREGVVWRFQSEGNRAQFQADPGVYQPQYGGYDPVEAASGKAVAGRPELWVISGERLFLFSNAATREDFLARTEFFHGKAEKAWPDLRQTLAN